MIKVDEVSKSIGGKPVIHDVSFHIAQGEVVGLLGPNGAGKTTMIRLMNDVITPDHGMIHIDGQRATVHGNTIRQLSGVVTESAGLYPELTARENLNFFARLYGVKQPQRRIDQLLMEFELKEHEDKLIGKYSTGMKKRLAIAKALLHEPKLLFLDEPTNGLDPDGIRDMIGYLRKLNEEQGTTILICSHVLHQLEDVCSSYLFIDQGRLIEKGTLEELERKYAGKIVIHVKTGLRAGSSELSGYQVREAGEQLLEFHLQDEQAISDLLRLMLRISWVHEVQIMNRSLESIYFEVRRRCHEL
ncbi:ABC transporter ATP-binding protein [Paenibacillus pinihumi]|uniref:ABC transporter ATP-binding protein n=1 Tax=Paenibacillus pinihumi TaxID=669462 RepID=UPI000407C284|nr:ABC transporter ATP-binding protein [Paenibacillus pinihumi]